MNEQKQYTGLQKVLRRIEKDGLHTHPGITIGEPITVLALALDLNRKTILEWLRQDGTQLRTVPNTDSPLYKAVHANGGPVAVSKVLGVTHQAVTHWIAQGYVPTKRVAEFSIQFGVPREQILSPKVRSASGAGGEL